MTSFPNFQKKMGSGRVDQTARRGARTIDWLRHKSPTTFILALLNSSRFAIVNALFDCVRRSSVGKGA
jgi:hypothetical protein